MCQVLGTQQWRSHTRDLPPVTLSSSCSPHLPNSGIKLGEGGEARCGRLEILGLVAGLRLALSLLPLPAGSAH